MLRGDQPGVVGEDHCLDLVAEHELAQQAGYVAFPVASLMYRRPASSALDRPAASSRSTSVSRSVRADSEAGVARWAGRVRAIEAEQADRRRGETESAHDVCPVVTD